MKFSDEIDLWLLEAIEEELSMFCIPSVIDKWIFTAKQDPIGAVRSISIGPLLKKRVPYENLRRRFQEIINQQAGMLIWITVMGEKFLVDKQKVARLRQLVACRMF